MRAQWVNDHPEKHRELPAAISCQQLLIEHKTAWFPPMTHVEPLSSLICGSFVTMPAVSPSVQQPYCF